MWAELVEAQELPFELPFDKPRAHFAYETPLTRVGERGFVQLQIS